MLGTVIERLKVCSFFSSKVMCHLMAPKCVTKIYSLHLTPLPSSQTAYAPAQWRNHKSIEKGQQVVLKLCFHQQFFCARATWAADVQCLWLQTSWAFTLSFQGYLEKQRLNKEKEGLWELDVKRSLVSFFLDKKQLFPII